MWRGRQGGWIGRRGRGGGDGNRKREIWRETMGRGRFEGGRWGGGNGKGETGMGQVEGEKKGQEEGGFHRRI